VSGRNSQLSTWRSAAANCKLYVIIGFNLKLVTPKVQTYVRHLSSLSHSGDGSLREYSTLLPCFGITGYRTQATKCSAATQNSELHSHCCQLHETYHQAYMFFVGVEAWDCRTPPASLSCLETGLDELSHRFHHFSAIVQHTIGSNPVGFGGIACDIS
jgi:hypothetical protein